MDKHEALDQLFEAIGRRFAQQLHPEVQELVLQLLDEPGDRQLRMEWTDNDELRVVLDGIEVATL